MSNTSSIVLKVKCGDLLWHRKWINQVETLMTVFY